MIDQKTINREYPLPHPNNMLEEDVDRIKDSFEKIDIDVNDLYDTTTQSIEDAQYGTYWYATSTGTGADYEINLTPPLTALVKGMFIHMKAHVKNSGPTTVNVNSLGIKNVKKIDGSDLKQGDIPENSVITLIYDGTQFQLANSAVDKEQTGVNTSNIMRAFGEIQENHGGALLMEAGWSDSFSNPDEQGADETNSTGFQHDSANKLYKGTDPGLGLTSDKNYDNESDFLQQEWTNSNQSTSQVDFSDTSVGVPSLDQSSANTSGNEPVNNNSGGLYRAMTFIAGATGELSKISLNLKKNGSPDSGATFTAEIRSTNSDQPTTTILSSTESISVGSISSTAAWYDFTFGTKPNLTSGTKYAIVVTASYVAGANNIGWSNDNNSNTYANGSGYHGSDGISWTQFSNTDYAFKTYVDSVFVTEKRAKLSSGAFPTNCENGRISFDTGTSWFDIESRDSDTQLALVGDLTKDQTYSASTSNSPGENESKAFDDNSATYWNPTNSNAVPQWLKIEYITAIVVNKVTVEWIHPADYTYTFEGSNDDVSYDTLLTIDAKSYSGDTVTPETFNNSIGYKYYKLNITGFTGTNLVLREMEMFHVPSDGNYDYIIRMSEFDSGEVKLNREITYYYGTSNLDQTASSKVTNRHVGGGGSPYIVAGGNTFTPSINGKIDKINLDMQGLGSGPTDNMYLEIYATSGSPGAMFPTGPVLATSSQVSGTILGGNTVPGTSVDFTFTSSNQIVLTADVEYAWVFKRTAGNSSSHYYGISNETSSSNSGYTRGNYFENTTAQGNNWQVSPDGYPNRYFQFYNLPESALTNVPTSEYVSISDSEAQKTNTSGWLDINSGSVTETLNSQNAYYWLAFDPASGFGTNTEVKIFNQTGSVWRTIAKNNGTHWEYNDAVYDTTKLLLHGDGADGSTTFTDSGPLGHAFTVSGNAQIDTSQSKFGGSSMLFDGTSDYIQMTAEHSDLDLGASDWTIDYWIRYNSTSQAGKGVWTIGDSNDHLYLQLESNPVQHFYVYYSHPDHTNFTTTSFNRGSGVNVGQWYHHAFVKKGADFYMFEDGVQVATTYSPVPTDMGSFTNSKLTLGRREVYTDGYFNGWIDEFRISKSALWTSNFTPPTSAHTYVSGAASDYTGVAADTDDMLHAVSQAVSAQPANRMIGTQLADITDAEWVGTGGWSTSTNNIIRGVTLYSKDSSLNPSVAQYQLNYDSVRGAMDLQSKAYDPDFVPAEGYLWSQIEHSDSDGPGTFYITRNGGTEWETVPMTQQGLPLSGDIRIYRGTIDLSGQISGQDLKCRHQTEQGKDQFLHSWGLQAKP